MKYAKLELGQIEALVDKLGGLDAVHKILSGLAIIQFVKRFINMAVPSPVFSSWMIEEHTPGDPNFEWDLRKVALYLDEGQKIGAVKGVELREKLRGKAVLNANLLHYLVDHPELIPDDWKGKRIFFWGTIVTMDKRDKRSGSAVFSGFLKGSYVCCLNLEKDYYLSQLISLDESLDYNCPALVLA